MTDSSPEPNQRSEPERFKAVLDEAAAIKKDYVDEQIRFYSNRKLNWPRWVFRGVGSTIIICSASLPALAAADKLQYQYQYVTILSVLIAVLSGLSAFFRWDLSWKGRILTRVALEQFCAKWALELVRAQDYMKPEERIEHVCNATDDLLTNVNTVVSAESGTFFEGVKMPESDRTSK
jgi:hypothetical protein